MTLTPRPITFVHVIETLDGDLIVEKGLMLFDHKIRLVIFNISLYLIRKSMLTMLLRAHTAAIALKEWLPSSEFF